MPIANNGNPIRRVATNGNAINTIANNGQVVFYLWYEYTYNPGIRQ